MTGLPSHLWEVAVGAAPVLKVTNIYVTINSNPDLQPGGLLLSTSLLIMLMKIWLALPDTLDVVAAASLGCRFITAYRAIRHQGRLGPDQFVTVHGCGGVGLSAIQIANALGARVIAIDVTDEKCDLAVKLGAHFSINASKTPVVDAVKEISKGGAHLSIDALGSSVTCIGAIKSLRKRGRHVQVGLMTSDEGYARIPMSIIIANELEILGSHGMQAHKYKEMFEFIASNNIDLNIMIGATASLDDVPILLPELGEFLTTGITVINNF